MKPLREIVFDPSLPPQFPNVEQDRFYPVYQTSDTLCIAVDDLSNPVQHAFKKTVKLIHISPSDLESLFETGTLLDRILNKATKRGASDIHISAKKDHAMVNFRINGKLEEFGVFNTQDKQTISQLIKLHGGMDISKMTQPQDGRISFKQWDVRVGSLPTVYGEDFVLRIFNTAQIGEDLGVLGFTEKAAAMCYELLNIPSGLILVTGSTGSGKSTTLYSFLTRLLKTKKRNIVTLEDPVETILDGIRQSQVNPTIGYNFVTGLRAILRQDPDVIMIGEIRDKETAKITLEAAYTGHLVLSTLHTADTKTTMARLAGFELDEFMVKNTLRGIISQRLVETRDRKSRTALSEVLICPDRLYSFEDDLRAKHETINP